MNITLRDYQENVVNQTKKLLKQGKKHILVQLPTGGGKTIIFSYITKKSESNGKKILILTDRDELLKQAGGTISKFDINTGYVKAGAKKIDRRKNVWVAMSQTLRNRIGLEEWINWIKNEIDIVIIDEAHIQEFNYLFESKLLDDTIVLGFTATPIRNGKMRQLAYDYESIVRGPEVRELIKKGYLVNCDSYDMGGPSMSGVKLNAKGDFLADSMFQKFNSSKLYAGLLLNYEKYTPNQKMIVFCCNVEHAINTVNEFVNAGYKAKFIASKKGEPKKPKEGATDGEIERYKERLRIYNIYLDNYEKHSGTRKQIGDGFSNNEFKILVNVDILTKGYDEPSIEVVALNRATMSLALYLQMIGRGSRIFEGKNNFTLFDFGGNIERFGNYDDPRMWSLWHEKKSDIKGVPPLKRCGYDTKGVPLKPGGEVKNGCDRLIMVSADICPFCGFKPYKMTTSEIVELQLSQIKDENGVALKFKSFKDMSHKELYQYRKIKEHTSSWLWRQLWLRGREKEIEEFANKYHWNSATTKRAINFCKQKF